MADTIAFIDGSRSLCTVAPDGAGRRTLAAAKWDEQGRNTLGYFWPTWSPDGRRLAVSSIGIEGQDRILATTFIVEAESGQTLPLYRTPPGVPPVIAPNVPHYAYWSPDSRHLALVAPAKDGMTLFIANTETGRSAPVVAGAPLFPAWSPDGRRLLLHPGNQLLMVEVTEGLKIKAVASRALGFRTPAWAPDGSRIAFADQPEEGRLNLMTADPEGKGARVELALDGPAAFAWSPRGDAIALATLTNPQGPAYGGLRLLEAGTGRVTALSADEVLAFFWSPDGRRLACVVPSAVEGLHSWVVLDLPEHAGERPQARRLASYFPARDMLTLCAFFDQYACSHRVWSPDGSRLVWSGRLNLNGHGAHSLRELESRVLMAAVTGKEPPTSLSVGSLAFWSHT